MTAGRVTPRGAERWVRGHPWIYRSEVLDGPDAPGLVAGQGPAGAFHRSGTLLSQVRDPPPAAGADRPAGRRRLVAGAAGRVRRRAASGIDATAYRVVHGEGDGLPSLVVDRYDRWLVVQILSAGLETMREPIVAALAETARARRDPAAERCPGAAPGGALAEHGQWPRRPYRAEIEVREGAVRYLAAPWDGQKTGAFLDQRPNRILAGQLMPPGRPGARLLCLSRLLRVASGAARGDACWRSTPARRRWSAGAANAALNGLGNIEWREADVFEALREFERARERFDAIVLDPPAFAKSRASVPAALRGYREINLRAMRILAPGGFC